MNRVARAGRWTLAILFRPLADEAIDRSRDPQLDCGIELTVVERLEVALGDLARRGHRGGAVYAA